MMKYNTKELSPEDIGTGAELLRRGECVAFPTETVYGLGANALDEKAVAKIFAAKGRPSDNPLIVHCYDVVQLPQLAKFWPKAAEVLMDRFWPGPLTLVLPKTKKVPPIVTGGLDSVAVRIPDHPIALALLREAGIPIAAPSANSSGRPSPTRAEHVWQDLAGSIAAIVNGGATGWGVESTVLDCTTSPFRLLRPGGVTIEQLREVVAVEIDPGVITETSIPRSPGMKYRHYSPEAEVILVVGNDIQHTIQAQLERLQAQGKRTAVMAFSETKDSYRGTAILEMGSKERLDSVSANIYHLLREVDRLGIDSVIIEGISDEHLGMAIMNRFRKAASNNIIYS